MVSVSGMLPVRVAECDAFVRRWTEGGLRQVAALDRRIGALLRRSPLCLAAFGGYVRVRQPA